MLKQKIFYLFIQNPFFFFILQKYTLEEQTKIIIKESVS